MKNHPHLLAAVIECSQHLDKAAIGFMHRYSFSKGEVLQVISFSHAKCLAEMVAHHEDCDIEGLLTILKEMIFEHKQILETEYGHQGHH